MCIDLNDRDPLIIAFKSLSIDFFNITHLKNPTELINHLVSCTNYIFDNNDVRQYTDHGVNHIIRILRIFTSLDALYSWGNYEKLVFFTATLIHDIGMNYRVWCSDEMIAAGFPDPKNMSFENIRELHGELGYRLVNCQIDKKISTPINAMFTNGSMIWNKILFDAANIAVSHSGKKFIEKFSKEGTELRKSMTYNEVFRPYLLIVILRLCDELDGTFERVLVPEEITNWNIGDLSKKHWLSCLFVKETKIEIDTTGNINQIIIKLILQFPNTEDEEEVNKIHKFIKNFRLSKINTEVTILRDFLSKVGESYPLNVSVNTDESLKHKLHILFPPNVLSMIEGDNKLPIIPIDKDYIPIFPEVGEQIFNMDFDDSSPDTLLEDELQSWFDENASPPGHYELISKQHTSVYLNCRSLVSNPGLLKRIAQKFMLIFKENRVENINCVLSVGTSAITLGINLAYLLNSTFTFTFSKTKIQNGEDAEGTFDIVNAMKENYNFVETIPFFDNIKNINLLIVDDVLVTGDVIKEILDSLKISGLEFNRVYHCSIFKLGDQKISIDKRIGEHGYFWLIEEPEIYYWNGKESLGRRGKCLLCEKNQPLIRESKMY